MKSNRPTSAQQNMSNNWFGHVMMMGEEHIARRVLGAELHVGPTRNKM